MSQIIKSDEANDGNDTEDDFDSPTTRFLFDLKPHPDIYTEYRIKTTATLLGVDYHGGNFTMTSSRIIPLKADPYYPE
ncbi:hypothetical protein BpHYR1_051990 [Brachionus plicatilis]|uniref:Uncharacterized protein n=1 Tax=Brachionus plicatilis TaxID=10195 RepID=A0A3M7R889_BRAPC|nr:hypothetical protein BpHYR1_051990 [Brachionus plicatilis]